MSVLTLISTVVDVSVSVQKPKKKFDFFIPFLTTQVSSGTPGPPQIPPLMVSKREEREGVNTVIDLLYVAFTHTIILSSIILYFKLQLAHEYLSLPRNRLSLQIKIAQNTGIPVFILIKNGVSSGIIG